MTDFYCTTCGFERKERDTYSVKVWLYRWIRCIVCGYSITCVKE